MENGMTLSTLPKTWVLDLDGTILKHNGYKTDGVDTVLPGAREYLSGLPDAQPEQPPQERPVVEL